MIVLHVTDHLSAQVALKTAFYSMGFVNLVFKWKKIVNTVIIISVLLAKRAFTLMVLNARSVLII